MDSKILFITPPFTQLNTPYPATAYLKGFLNTRQIASYQADLGIEVILELFSQQGLSVLFDSLGQKELTLSPNAYRMYKLRGDYLRTVEPVMRFLQNKNPTLAHAICDRSFLPEASRFQQLEDLEWAFGTMGLQDKARHLATLYLEDLGDLIKETTDPHFGFSRYAERLGRTATHFDDLLEALRQPATLLGHLLEEKLEEKIQLARPELVCLSVPFPGNLLAALQCGRYIKEKHPALKIALGGGYANTELRSLADPRVFDFIDFVCLDDGEASLLSLLEYLDGQRPAENMKRVFWRQQQQVVYANGATEPDVPMKDTGTPDYSDLPLDQYVSVIEVVNPMHRLWSDGRWNKLTLAHGCYWGKCSFCDISLDYIKRYEPLTASLLCDRMETIVAQTGQTGFHFVDEAAPPLLLRELALEILRRKMVITWWTNIRFERAFTHDLARLLKASGCIAVAGGLEVASDRLLERMKKGVTVAKVAQVADAFTSAGIMVHAYLMYGFPTQTEQETVDSLEMVRQLFETGVLQSGFWHRFAMTAHSPVGLDPQKFKVARVGPQFGGFADNDLYHEDPSGADHDRFAEGLRISLFNFMHGSGYEEPLQQWFDFEIPEPSIAPDYIACCLEEGLRTNIKMSSRLVWLGGVPLLQRSKQSLKKKRPETEITIVGRLGNRYLTLETETAHWVLGLLTTLRMPPPVQVTYQDAKQDYEESLQRPFETLTGSPVWQILQEEGLLVL